YRSVRLSAMAPSTVINDPAPPERSTLSLHDALPICLGRLGHAAVARPVHRRHPNVDVRQRLGQLPVVRAGGGLVLRDQLPGAVRSEDHTSELQSRSDLVCRLLLENKNGDGTGLITTL